MDENGCVCAVHGRQPVTFVCSHITTCVSPETVGFVTFAPEDENDLRDARCEACDAYLQANGGEWADGSVEVPSGISILCSECYREREGDARLACRRLIRQN